MGWIRLGNNRFLILCLPVLLLALSLVGTVESHSNSHWNSNHKKSLSRSRWWTPCVRNEGCSSTTRMRDTRTSSSPLSSSSSSEHYRNLEDFVLQELQRHNSKESSSSYSHQHHHHHHVHRSVWSPAWHLAASSNSPRGGGVTASIHKKSFLSSSSQNQRKGLARTAETETAAAAGQITSTPTLTHSFWTFPSNLHLQSFLNKENIHATSSQPSQPVLAQERNRLSDTNLLDDDTSRKSSIMVSSQLSTAGTVSNHKQYAKHLKNRNNLNISRKLTHAAFGLLFATLNQLIPKTTFLPCMTVLTSFVLVMEMVRYRKGFGWINDVLHFFLGSSLRKHEMEGQLFTGSFYYFLGVTLTSYFYPTSCASLGIVQLALADPAASYFGRLTKDISWSRINKGFYGMGRNKGLLGFLMGAIFCVPFNYQILSLAQRHTTSDMVVALSSSSLPLPLPFCSPLQIGFLSLILGLAGAFADLCVPSPALIIPVGPKPRFHVDDNVMVPIFAGYACTQVFRMIGWTQVHLAPWLFL